MQGLNLLEAYRLTHLIRTTEEELSRRYHVGKMRTPMHLSIGQELVAVGVCLALGDQDKVYSTHRCHAHYLAKGGSLNGLVAELYGKATGCAGGLGGSMHLVDESVGFMGTSAIVGSSISVALGHAWAKKLRNEPGVVVAFTGDAGPETGQFWESINLAAVHQLPLVIVVENNGWATQTPVRDRRVSDLALAQAVRHMGIRVGVCDDELGGIRPIYSSMVYGVQKPPHVLFVKTHRYREHVGPNYDFSLGHRSEAEVRAHEAHDPLETLRMQVLPRNAERIAAIEQENEGLVAAAFVAAEAAPWPQAVA